MTQPQMPPDLTSSEAYKRGESPQSAWPLVKSSAVDPVNFELAQLSIEGAPLDFVRLHPSEWAAMFVWATNHARASVLAYAAARDKAEARPQPSAAPDPAWARAMAEQRAIQNAARAIHMQTPAPAEPQLASAELSQSPIVNQQPPQVNDEALALIGEATPFMERFAKTNPKWPFPSPGRAEHPAHAWLERAAALKGKP